MRLKRQRIGTLGIGLLVMMPALASAQFDFGGGAATPASKPWEEFKLNTKTRVKLDYRNSGIDSILSMFQKTSGISIVKDPALTGQLTLTSAKAVSLKEAFAILNGTLQLKGYEMVKEDSILIIRQKKVAPQGAGGGFDPSMLAGMMPAQGALKVYPVKFANASQLARVINEVFQTADSNPFAALFGGGGGGNRFGGGGQGGNRFGGGGQGGNRFGGGGFGGFGRGSSTPTVKASSDDFSNSLIINAPDKEQGQVRDLIKQLDKPSELPLQSKVYKLQFASSDDLVAVVQNILNAAVPRGRSGATTAQNQGPAAFINAIRGTSAGSGQVVSDARSNSLIVTASDENLTTVEKVVKELDKDVVASTTTFVFQLQNARADSVASLVQQAFGTRQGLNNGGGRNNQNATGRVGGGNNNNNANRGTGNNNRVGGLGGSVAPGQNPSDLQVSLQDPNAESGDLLTNIGVTQGFGGLFGGQNRGGQNQTTKPATGRDEQGRLVNVRDLTGQVTAIPDINTNSIIVVTSPENAAILKTILDQLDKIPEQVLIETIIVEATLDASSKLGVEWNFTNSNSRAAGDPTSTGNSATRFGLQSATGAAALEGFRYTLTGSKFSAFLNALQTDRKFQVLSTPKIFTSNNVQAQINISQSVPYVLNSRQDINGQFTFNYAFLDVGIVLTVTPRITSNGYVTMDVTQTANDLEGYTSFNAPIVNQRQADTTVSVKDGETIILGGIIRKTVTSTIKKVPVLGDIPILGQLFRSKDKSDVKTELLVFLTPRIVRDPDEARRLRIENEKKMSPETRGTLDKAIKGSGGSK